MRKFISLYERPTPDTTSPNGLLGGTIRDVETQLILDRYRPLSQLGEGGFATVVLAWDTRMQRRVAIKRLPLPLDERGVPQQPPGLAEARTAAMLNHPNIVTVFDFDTDADEAFLVMEHVDGASLGEVLDSAGGSLTLDEAAAVAEGVASALEFAHDNGVLHLDIKPDNVLITRDGRVKVADFGMAELSSLSGHGPAWGGTPGYMPIEQLQGAPVHESTDEWAFAAVLFEALTGHNPFDEDTIEGAIVQLEEYEPPLPSSIAADLPPEVDDVLLAALGLRPQDRYRCVADFADALLPHLGDPRAGRASLAELVDEYFEEAPESHTRQERGIGLWDRLQGRLGGLLVRIVAAVEAGWLAWSGLAPFGLELPAMVAAVGLVALAGAVAPALGVGLGLGCLIAGIFAAESWVAGIALLLLGLPWWWFIARRSTGAAVLPLAGPVLGVARLAPAQPLLAGFALRPLPAAVTALLGGALTGLAAAVSARSVPYLDIWAPYVLDVWRAELAVASVKALVTSPAAYIALAGWPLAAVIMSVACSRATRLGAVVGAIGGSAALAGMYLLAQKASVALGDPAPWAGPRMAAAVGGSLILVLLVAALGAPIRAEDDEAPHARAARRG